MGNKIVLDPNADPSSAPGRKGDLLHYLKQLDVRCRKANSPFSEEILSNKAVLNELQLQLLRLAKHAQDAGLSTEVEMLKGGVGQGPAQPSTVLPAGTAAATQPSAGRREDEDWRKDKIIRRLCAIAHRVIEKRQEEEAIKTGLDVDDVLGNEDELRRTPLEELENLLQRWQGAEVELCGTAEDKDIKHLLRLIEGASNTQLRRVCDTPEDALQLKKATFRSIKDWPRKEVRQFIRKIEGVKASSRPRATPPRLRSTADTPPPQPTQPKPKKEIRMTATPTPNDQGGDLVGHLTTRIRGLEERNDTLQEQNSKLREENVRLADAAQQLTAARQEVARLQPMENDLKDAQREATRLADELHRSQTEAKNLKQQVQGHNEVVDQLKRQCNEAQQLWKNGYVYGLAAVVLAIGIGFGHFVTGSWFGQPTTGQPQTASQDAGGSDEAEVRMMDAPQQWRDELNRRP